MVCFFLFCYFKHADSSFPRECDDMKNITSGVYTIYPDGFHPKRAFCIVDNHNKETWTVRTLIYL